MFLNIVKFCKQYIDFFGCQRVYRKYSLTRHG